MTAFNDSFNIYQNVFGVYHTRDEHNSVLATSSYAEFEIAFASNHISNGQTPIVPEGFSTSFNALQYEESLYPTTVVTPSVFNAGLLLSEIPLTITVWNFSDTPITLNNIIATQNEGVEFTNPTFPDPFNANEAKEYNFNITLKGSSSLAATYQFVFSNGDTKTARILGNRLVVLPQLPRKKYQEKIEFKTAVTETANGKEYFQTLYVKPKRSYTYTYQLADANAGQKLINTLSFASTSTYGMPVWEQETPLVQGITAGDKVINFDTTVGDFVVGRSIAVIHPDGRYIAGKIAEVTNTTATLEYPVTSDLEAGSAFVCPLTQGKIIPDSKQKLYSGHYRELTVQYRITDDISITGSGTSYYPDNINSITLVTDEIELFSKTSSALDITGIDLIDYGLRQYELKGNHPLAKRRFTFAKTLEGRSDIDSFREWLHHLKGKSGLFYAIDATTAYYPNTDINSGDTIIYFKKCGFAEIYNLQVQSMYAQVVTPDGTFYPLVIDNVIDGENEGMQFNQSFGASYTADQVTVRRLMLLRPDSDVFDINYERREYAAISFPCKEVYL